MIVDIFIAKQMYSNLIRKGNCDGYITAWFASFASWKIKFISTKSIKESQSGFKTMESFILPDFVF